ncbi:MAG TPA: hypothetical protein VI916_11600 [Acidimicrobiia bacterium]|nr:hypothetical protein [Acidimicrobiia bacterium]
MDAFEGLRWGAVVSAFALGLRHGFDWDHVAAIADITGSQRDRRRSLTFSTLYILGHGVVVTVLGLAAIALGSTIPAWLDGAMGRVIGATLLGLGVYVMVSLIRNGRDARLQSRWMLAISGARRAIGWLRTRHASGPEPVVIDHDHEHPVVEAHVDEHVPTAVVHDPGGVHVPATRHGHHRHRHVHFGALPDDPFMEYGRGTSFLVGMLHGVGAETPTQMVLFASAAGAASAWVGVAFLVAFVAGLTISNTAVALGSRAGMLSARGNFGAYVAVSLVVAVLSLYLGTVYLFDLGDGLPALLT